MNIIGYGNGSGSQLYRLEQVFKYLNRISGYTAVVSPKGVEDEALAWADVIWPQATIDPKMIGDIWAYQVEKGKTVVVDRDDSLYANKDNPFLTDHKKLHASEWSKQLLTIADVVTCASPALVEECKEFNKNVILIPNDVDLELWDYPQYESGGVMRIGWAGSITHKNDLAMVLPAIKKILMTRDDVKFVYCGDPFPKEYLKDLPATKYEYITGVNDKYMWPRLAHTMQLDIGLAPLEPTHFNKCRSYLKYMEYGMCKTAGVYSPTVFSEVIDGKNGLIAQTPEQWEHSINKLLDNKKLRAKMGETAYDDIRTNHSIDKHIGRWQHAINVGIQNRRNERLSATQQGLNTAST